MSQSTAGQYKSTLLKFERYLLKEHNKNLDSLILNLNRKLSDPYDILTS